MYAIVIRHLSGIQKGIQGAHAIVQYGVEHNTPEYKQWSTKDVTMKFLETGTVSSFARIIRKLKKLGVKNVTNFIEPDLGGITTAIAFLIPEQVWNSQKYEDTESDFLALRAYLKTFNLAN